MAKTFTFTSPNGKTYDISGPDDATQEQAFAILQSQIGTPGPGSKDFAPGVDKPGLPDSRTLPTPKNFPGFGNPSAEYARRQEPVTRMMDGAARMTRAGADAKFGGASDIMRGAGEIALPLAAVPLAGAGSVGAGAAMLGRMAVGAGGGYLGGKAARAMVPEDQPGLQDFVENAGATAGGLLAGGVSESPKVGAFVKGAATEVPKKLPSAMMAGAAGHAIGRPGTMAILEALYAGPSIIRGGMAESAGKPWLGPGARGVVDAAKGLFERNPSDLETRLASLGKTPEPKKPGLMDEFAAEDARLKNVQDFMDRKRATPKPEPKSFVDTPEGLKPIKTPSENMAARMAAQDAAGQPRSGGLMSDVVADEEKRSSRVPHDSLDKHEIDAANKIKNISEYIKANGGFTEEHLGAITDDDFRKIADAAIPWGKSKGNPTPPSGRYSSASVKTDTWKKIVAELKKK